MANKQITPLISEAIGDSWQLFKNKWHLIYGLYLLPLISAAVYSLLLPTIKNELIATFLSFLYLLTQIVLGMGIIKGILNLTRNQKINKKIFTDMIPLVFNYVLGGLLLAATVIAGLILLILPGIYLLLKYYFAPILIIDKGLKPIAAMKASAKMTKGTKWEIVGFFAANMILAYSGIFALIIGLFITIPLASMSHIYFYKKLSRRLN